MYHIVFNEVSFEIIAIIIDKNILDGQADTYCIVNVIDQNLKIILLIDITPYDFIFIISVS